MYTAFGPLLLFLLFSSVSFFVATSQNTWHDVLEDDDFLYCFDRRAQPRQPSVKKNITANCLTAIEAIPKGLMIDAHNIVEEGLDPTGRISIPLDRRRYPFPASFGWGNCLVTIWMDIDYLPHLKDQLDFPAILTYKLWPEAGKASQEVVRRCIKDGDEGGYVSLVAIGGVFVDWGVELGYFPRKGSISLAPLPYNVYIAKDAEKGELAIPTMRMQKQGKGLREGDGVT